MDSSTSDFITQKALSYGLHSCSYCQAALVDLTSLAPLGAKCDNVGTEDSFDERSISLYYETTFIRQFVFSRDTIAEATPSCPFFKLLAGRRPIHIGQLSEESRSDMNSLHLRLPRGMLSHVPYRALAPG